MCIAAPMKLINIETNGRFGTVLFSGNELRVNLNLISAEIGDYLLVHAGCAVEVVKKESAEELLDIFTELEEAAYGL